MSDGTGNVDKARNDEALMRAKIFADRADKLLVAGVTAHQELIKVLFTISSASLVAVPAFYGVTRSTLFIPLSAMAGCVGFFAIAISASFGALFSLQFSLSIHSLSSDRSVDIYLNSVLSRAGIDTKKVNDQALELQKDNNRLWLRQANIARWATILASLSFGAGASLFLYVLANARPVVPLSP